MAQASLGSAAAAAVAADRNAAATETLLALCRPLEAFLRTGAVTGIIPRPPGRAPASSAVAKAQGGAGGGGGDIHGGGGAGSGGGRDSRRRLLKGRGGGHDGEGGLFDGPPPPTAVAARRELEQVLLPRCIVPLFEAAAGSAKGVKSLVSGTI